MRILGSSAGHRTHVNPAESPLAVVWVANLCASWPMQTNVSQHCHPPLPQTHYTLTLWAAEACCQMSRQVAMGGGGVAYSLSQEGVVHHHTLTIPFPPAISPATNAAYNCSYSDEHFLLPRCIRVCRCDFVCVTVHCCASLCGVVHCCMSLYAVVGRCGSVVHCCVCLSIVVISSCVLVHHCASLHIVVWRCVVRRCVWLWL